MNSIPTIIITLTSALICFYVIYSMSGWNASQEPTKKKPYKPTIWFKNGKEL